MKKAFPLLASFIFAAALQAQVITQWNFNSTTNDADYTTGAPPNSSAPLPSTGVGTAKLVGGTTATYDKGITSSDPNTTDNSGWNTTNYPLQGNNSGTAGVEFDVSTLGVFGPIQLTLDFRQSGTASRYFQLQVSSDGVNFAAPSGGTALVLGPINSPNSSTSFSNSGTYANNSGGGTQTFVDNIQYTLPAGSPYENNPKFAFRWVSIFDPTGTNGNNYIASNKGTTTDYAATGTARFDMVTVASVPEPSIVSLLAGGALLGAAQCFRRRRRA